MNKLLSNIQNYLEYYQEVYGNSITIEQIENLSGEPHSADSSAFAANSKKSNIDNNSKNNTVNTIITSDNNNLKNNCEWADSRSLDELYSCIHNCRECKLGNTRTKLVFGFGNPNADILVIGEGPGADEDATGLPFVGRAGQLLTKILEAIQLSRDEVYIANIVKCRPPGNRRPDSEEVSKCEPYLIKQIELIKPKFILALGLTALETLFKQKFRMADTRGKLMEYHGIKTLATYHPAALLRNPNLKRDTWEDVKFLRKLYLESKEN